MISSRAFQDVSSSSTYHGSMSMFDDYYDSLSPRYGQYTDPYHQLHMLRPCQQTSADCSDSKFKVMLNVNQFKPNEIDVKTMDNHVVVHGKHEEVADEHGFVSREFTRRYPLPDGVEPLNVSSSFTKDGVLTIEAPRKVAEPPKVGRAIPISIQKSMYEEETQRWKRELQSYKIPKVREEQQLPEVPDKNKQQQLPEVPEDKNKQQQLPEVPEEENKQHQLPEVPEDENKQQLTEVSEARNEGFLPVFPTWGKRNISQDGKYRYLPGVGKTSSTLPKWGCRKSKQILLKKDCALISSRSPTVVDLIYQAIDMAVSYQNESGKANKDA